MRSRDSKFETKVFVMSSSNFRRSLSRCVSDLARGDSAEFSGRFGVREGRILASSDVQCRTNSLRKAKVVPRAFSFRWHRNSSLQIKPLQPTNLFFSANAAVIRIDWLDFQSGTRPKREMVSECRHPRGVCCGRLHEPKTLPKYRVSTFLNSSTIRSFALSPASP